MLFDRNGRLEETFQNFSALAGCEGKGLNCLRAASPEALENANVKLNEEGPLGIFAFGPSTDGKWVRQLPSLEPASGMQPSFLPISRISLISPNCLHLTNLLYLGNSWKGLDSLILFHISDEADMFVPPNILTDADFSSIINYQFPPYAQVAGVTAAIETRYPPVWLPASKYLTEFDRAKHYIGDSTFYCNVRFLSDAYDGKTYNMQYSVTPGLHANDLFPTFYNLNININIFGHEIPFPLIPGFGNYAQAYQSYLTSHARTGDPNTFRKNLGIPTAISWPKVSTEDEDFTGVLNAGNLGFSIIRDTETSRSRCGFWRGVAENVTKLGDYLPAQRVEVSRL